MKCGTKPKAHCWPSLVHRWRSTTRYRSCLGDGRGVCVCPYPLGFYRIHFFLCKVVLMLMHNSTI